MSDLAQESTFKLERVKVPFLYATDSKTFDFEKIKDEIAPVTFEKDRTMTAIGFELSKNKRTLLGSAVACFSVSNVVVAVKVQTITVKKENEEFSEEEVKKQENAVEMPLFGKISQLISTCTEQITGVPYLVDLKQDDD